MALLELSLELFNLGNISWFNVKSLLVGSVLLDLGESLIKLSLKLLEFKESVSVESVLTHESLRLDLIDQAN